VTAPETLEGWFSLHDLRVLDQSAWLRLQPEARAQALTEVAELFASFEQVTDAAAGHSVAYSMIGHKSDLLLFHLRPDVTQLHDLEKAFDRTLLATMCTRAYSFLSVIELSRHGLPEGMAENVAQSPYVQARLYPEIPGHSAYICFYPMNKKRSGLDNWYVLSSQQRAELMRAHGKTGRKYAGKVSQIITGAMGLDDWEWGVTLFADDPLEFKKLVYEMRFDEVSARYAEFGPFYVGSRLYPEKLGEWLGE
jgi:chlorite dismutase